MDSPISVIGVPMDLGADRRGVDMGPSAIRYAGLAEQLHALSHDCTDGGDVRVPRPEGRDPDAASAEGERAKYLAETRDVCLRLADAVSDAVADGAFPLVLGGDHSIAAGSVAGVAEEGSTGVLWFDAHADFNTPRTSPSGNVHGMPLAAILGVGPFADGDWGAVPGVDAADVALIGVRSVDESERPGLLDSDVSVYTMSDIDAQGITAVVEDAIDVVTADTEAVHVSLDMDLLDPSEAPGVGTPVRGGVSYREAHAAMERLADPGVTLSSMELVEVNPILDEHNRTADLAVELTASALGKRVL